MNKRIQHSLRKKSWSESSIKEAAQIMQKARKNKHFMLNFLDRIIDYTILLSGSLLLVGLSFLLFPVLLLFNSIPMYLIVIILSFSLGILYSALVIDLMFIERHHHILIVFLVPIIGFFSMYYVVTQVNRLISLLNLSTMIHNSVIVSLVFSIVFIIPFIFHFSRNLAEIHL